MYLGRDFEFSRMLRKHSMLCIVATEATFNAVHCSDLYGDRAVHKVCVYGVEGTPYTVAEPSNDRHLQDSNLRARRHGLTL